MPTFLVPPAGSPYGGSWPAPVTQLAPVPNVFTIPLAYDPATMPNPAVRYSDLYAALKTPYAPPSPADNYPVFPGSQLETLVNLLAGPTYDLDAINAAGVATISRANSTPPYSYVGGTTLTRLGVARDGYFDLTEAFGQYTGAPAVFSFRLNAFLPFTVEEQGGCAAVIRPAAYQQTKPDASGVDFTAPTFAVPLLWSQLAAALKPSNLVAQFASGSYATPVDFSRAAAASGFDATVFGIAGAKTPTAGAPWGVLAGDYDAVSGTIITSALNPYFADGDFGAAFLRFSCAHSIIQ